MSSFGLHWQTMPYIPALALLGYGEACVGCHPGSECDLSLAHLISCDDSQLNNLRLAATHKVQPLLPSPVKEVLAPIDGSLDSLAITATVSSANPSELRVEPTYLPNIVH